MSKKRTEAESSNGEQTTEGSDPLLKNQQRSRPASVPAKVLRRLRNWEGERASNSRRRDWGREFQAEKISQTVSQQQDNVKRAKLVSLSDTTLQDLPFELLECILVKVVAMEVKDMKMAKSVWKEKAGLVMDRLQTVCSQWSSICATNYFRNEIHRTLDGTAQETCRLEILHQYPIQFEVIDMTSVKDEIFMLCKPNGEDYVINVLDCNNMAEVKDVILLPGISPRSIKGCSVSNCVYVHVHKAELDQSSKGGDSVVRITKAEEHQFTISPWVTDLINWPLLSISVSATGNLVALLRLEGPSPTIVSIYAANGSVHRHILLDLDIFKDKYYRDATNAIQKPNGNLVLISVASPYKTLVTEIDMFKNVVRRYQSALPEEIGINFVDNYGRILISNWHSRFELLDSEFNRLDFSGLPKIEEQFFRPSKLHFNSERNEILFTYSNLFNTTFGLAIYRFISE